MFILLIFALLSTTTASNNTDDATTNTPVTTTKEILKADETGDPSKVEIVKQIRRLNDDGSYTIGYEADDGTFKIESRDVRGNVKGTFGYIDKDGEIKRVTYSSSGDTTPVPVTTSTAPPNVVRANKTVSSSTRRPLATVVYPTRQGYTTRGTVIQSIPRRRASARTTTDITTEKQPEETTTNVLNLYKQKEETKTRTQILKPMPAGEKDDLIPKQTTTKLPTTVKHVYESSEKDADAPKSIAVRRELSNTSPNPHMVSLQQSAGDDSTDYYGSLSLGTVRPLFTTTTPRPRLVPIHSIVAGRQKIQQYHDVPLQDQETTIEASTGRVFDQDNVVTANPVPVVHIAPREHEERYQQPIYRRPPPTLQFRTREYLKDNPGSAVPIGNQRPFLQYDNHKILEPQFLREPQQKTEETTPSYEVRQVNRLVPIPVDDRGIPIPGYQPRFVNTYRQPRPLFRPRYQDPIEEMNAISTPVSTRDLRRLLHILILRQNRLQNIMDQMMPGPLVMPYFRDDYRYHPRYQEDFDYRYDAPYRNMYMSQYEDPQYEGQRYMVRRRMYQRAYDSTGSSSDIVEESPEYLPPDVREALLLKMLILAISPDFMPTPAPPTELTTATPMRKQVRNVQILGDEHSLTESKTMQRH